MSLSLEQQARARVLKGEGLATPEIARSIGIDARTVADFFRTDRGRERWIGERVFKTPPCHEPPPPYIDGSASAWQPDAITIISPKRLTASQIKHQCCSFFRVTEDEMNGPRRTRPLVRYRQIAMWLAKSLTGLSYPEIGRRFGGRDHTTVMHAVRVVSARAKVDAEFREQVEGLRIALSARFNPPPSEAE
jgi:hypothetical protein